MNKTNMWLAVFVSVIGVIIFMVMLGAENGVDSANIVNESIIEQDLAAIGVPADDECLTYDSASQGFDWDTCGAGGGVHPVDLTSDVTGLLPVTNGGTGLVAIADDELIIGSGVDSYAAVAIPDCDSFNIYRLQYDTTTNAIICDEDQVNLASTNDVNGTLPALSGGTGFALYTNSEMLIGDGSGQLVQRDVAACSGTNYFRLQYDFIGPTWLCDTDKIDLVNDIVGIVAVPNGGTGTSVITSNEVMIGLGTAAITTVNTGTVGFVLTSTGATAPTWQVAAAGSSSPAHGRFSTGTNQYVLPGVHFSDGAGAIVTAADNIYYHPIYVETTITVDQMIINVTGAAVASSTCRLGIYDATVDWQPDTLIIDAGTVACDSTGVKILNHADQVLTADRYLLAIISDGGPSLRSIFGTVDGEGIETTLDTAPLARRLTVSGQGSQWSGGFNASGTDWNSVAYTSTGFDNMIFLDVGTP